MYHLLIAHEEIGAQIERIRSVEWEELGFSRVICVSSYGEVLEKMPRPQPCIVLMQIKIRGEYCFSTIEELERRQAHAGYILVESTGDFERFFHRIQSGNYASLFFLRDFPLFERLAQKFMLGQRAADPLQRMGDSGRDLILGRPLSEFSQPVAAALEAVREGYGETLTLSGVAGRLHYNSKYLGRLFRSETRLKFSEYLLAYRMARAKDLLENTTEKVDYIAHRVGFQLTNNFYSYFKSYYGLSPSDFRRKFGKAPPPSRIDGREQPGRSGDE